MGLIITFTISAGITFALITMMRWAVRLLWAGLVNPNPYVRAVIWVLCIIAAVAVVTAWE